MEPSALVPIEKVRHPDIHNSKHRNMPEERRCRGHKKTGERCQRPAILGGTVCRHHGGGAPHVKAAARARIENYTDRAARLLLEMCENADLPPAIKLAALRDALDRGGVAARSGVDVTIDVPRYQKLFDRLDREAMGRPDVVDGEIVGDADFGNGSEP